LSSLPIALEDSGEFLAIFFPGASLAPPAAVMIGARRFVYILRSQAFPTRYYTGLTSDVSARLVAHNAGRCRHTVTRGPWVLDVIVEFANEERAIRFEQYLKSGSGCAFAKRHLR
jgi:predicted GIY-YIG superfamily endonuclease